MFGERESCNFGRKGVKRDLNINPDLKQQTLVATFERKTLETVLNLMMKKMLKALRVEKNCKIIKF